MTDNPLDPRIRELTWRRKITPGEEARLREWLLTHPEAQGDSEMETALTEALDRLPNVPVASNFTAQVVQAVEREIRVQERSKPSGWHFWQWRWLPRAAVAALILGGGFHIYSHQQHEQEQRRQEVAKRLLAVSSLQDAAPLSAEVLEDYDTIRALNQAAPDETLLSLLQ